MSSGWVGMAWVRWPMRRSSSMASTVVEGDLLALVLLGGLAFDLEDRVGAVGQADDVVWAVIVD